MASENETPISAFRIPLDLKAEAKAAAAEDGIDLTKLVITGMHMYLDQRGKK